MIQGEWGGIYSKRIETRERDDDDDVVAVYIALTPQPKSYVKIPNLESWRGRREWTDVMNRARWARSSAVQMEWSRRVAEKMSGRDRCGTPESTAPTQFGWHAAIWYMACLIFNHYKLNRLIWLFKKILDSLYIRHSYISCFSNAILIYIGMECVSEPLRHGWDVSTARFDLRCVRLLTLMLRWWKRALGQVEFEPYPSSGVFSLGGRPASLSGSYT